MKILAAAITAAVLLAPANAQTPKKRNFNLSVSDGRAERCSDLKVTSKNGEVAQAAESFTLAPGQASAVELSGEHGVITVRGWDHPEYTVEACKVAVADNQATAENVVRGIMVTHSGGRFTVNGPTTDDANWQFYFLVHAPRNGNVDVDTKNGPISVSGVQGNVKARAVNGPISLNDVAGVVDVKTTNGPISFNGGGGEVHLTANNGPISLNLQGEVWNGSLLEAHTDNGPVSLNIPDTYRTGVRLQTSGGAPMSCRAGACQTAWTDKNTDQRVMQLNGSSETIRVSTNHGPVSVNSSSNKLKKII